MSDRGSVRRVAGILIVLFLTVGAVRAAPAAGADTGVPTCTPGALGTPFVAPGPGVKTNGLGAGAPVYYEIGAPTGSFAGVAPKGIMLVIHGGLACGRQGNPGSDPRVCRSLASQGLANRQRRLSGVRAGSKGCVLVHATDPRHAAERLGVCNRHVRWRPHGSHAGLVSQGSGLRNCPCRAQQPELARRPSGIRPADADIRPDWRRLRFFNLARATFGDSETSLDMYSPATYAAERDCPSAAREWRERQGEPARTKR